LEKDSGFPKGGEGKKVKRGLCKEKREITQRHPKGRRENGKRVKKEMTLFEKGKSFPSRGRGRAKPAVLKEKGSSVEGTNRRKETATS